MLYAGEVDRFGCMARNLLRQESTGGTEVSSRQISCAFVIQVAVVQRINMLTHARIVRMTVFIFSFNQTAYHKRNNVIGIVTK